MVHVQSQGEHSLPWFQMDVSDNIHTQSLVQPPRIPMATLEGNTAYKQLLKGGSGQWCCHPLIMLQAEAQHQVLFQPTL